MEPIREETGYELRNSLIDVLGSNGVERGKAYRLTITLTDTNQGVALQNDATITRYNDTLTANFVRQAKEWYAAQGKAGPRAFAGYGVPEGTEPRPAAVPRDLGAEGEAGRGPAGTPGPRRSSAPPCTATARSRSCSAPCTSPTS